MDNNLVYAAVIVTILALLYYCYINPTNPLVASVSAALYGPRPPVKPAGFTSQEMDNHVLVPFKSPDMKQGFTNSESLRSVLGDERAGLKSRMAQKAFTSAMVQQQSTEHMEDSSFDYNEKLTNDQVTPEIKKNHKNFVDDKVIFARTPVSLDSDIETPYTNWQGLAARSNMPRVRDGARSVSGIDDADYRRNGGTSISNWGSGVKACRTKASSLIMTPLHASIVGDSSSLSKAGTIANPDIYN